MDVEQKSVSIHFSLQQLRDVILAAKLVAKAIETKSLCDATEERNAIASVVAILEITGLHTQNLLRCMCGELNAIAVINPGNIASSENMEDLQDVLIKVK